MARIILLSWLLLVAIGTWATARLAYRVWNSGKKIGLLVEVATTLAVTAASFGILAAVRGLQKIFMSAVAESGDPTQSARASADAIATALNCTALALALWIPSFIVLSVVLRERKRRPR